MNYLPDEVFDNFILIDQNYFSESDQTLLIEDILFLEKKLEPYGILKNLESPSLLMTQNIDTLALFHLWQSELFAIKFFKEYSKFLPKKT